MSQSDLEDHIQLNHIFKNIGEYTNSLGPLNTTSCRLCHDKFISQSKLESHVQQKHLFDSIGEYVDSLGPLKTNDEVHVCRLCNKKISCTEAVVLLHLSEHDISLEDYDKTFMNSEADNHDNLNDGNEVMRIQLLI